MKLKNEKNVDDKPFKCVNCGTPATALYKTYGPSVLKLTKCKTCNGIVDKYIEYDPVIVMIDLVLVSKEAQRHVLYNTEFKSFWKLFIILIMLETYGLWRSDSLFNMVVNSMCDMQTNNTLNAVQLFPLDIRLPERWRAPCWGWQPESSDSELFIWEKNFYVQFLSTFAGIVAFIVAMHGAMKLIEPVVRQNNVTISRVLKTFSLAYVSILFTLPALVWGGSSADADTKLGHYALVFAYGLSVFCTAFTVLYECPMVITIVILIASNCAKYVTTYYATPYLRSLMQ